MQYIVLTDYYLQEQAIQLEAGQVFADGALEPDVTASLFGRGIIGDANAALQIDELEAESDSSDDLDPFAGAAEDAEG